MKRNEASKSFAVGNAWGQRRYLSRSWLRPRHSPKENPRGCSRWSADVAFAATTL